jgi:hypothetical protein
VVAGVIRWGSSDCPWLDSPRTCLWMWRSAEGWRGSGANGVGSGMCMILLTPSIRVSVTSSGSGVVSGLGECTGSSLMLEGCLGSWGGQMRTPIHSWSPAGISSSELVTNASRVLFHLIRNQELLINSRERSPCEAVWI